MRLFTRIITRIATRTAALRMPFDGEDRALQQAIQALAAEASSPFARRNVTCTGRLRACAGRARWTTFGGAPGTFDFPRRSFARTAARPHLGERELAGRALPSMQ